MATRKYPKEGLECPCCRNHVYKNIRFGICGNCYGIYYYFNNTIGISLEDFIVERREYLNTVFGNSKPPFQVKRTSFRNKDYKDKRNLGPSVEF